MLLTEAVENAIPDSADPAVLLALSYADAIDQATHVPLGLAEALDELQVAAAIADEASESGDDRAMHAFRKVAAAVAVATILDKLGPKFLASLDALLLTPKAKAAISGRLEGAARPKSPLDEIRERNDSRHLRSAG